MYQLRNILILALSIAVMLGCRSSKKLTTIGFENELFGIATVTGCAEGHSGDAVDSQVGKITCEEVVLSYNYGKYGPKGPMTAVESFEQSFKNYHYSKFLELTHIDPKLYKIFKDSATIVSILPAAEVTKETLFECGTCNAVATIDFLGERWYYPTTVNINQLTDPAGLEAYISDNTSLKLYTTETGQQAATLTPIPTTRLTDYLSITVTEGKLSKEKQRNLLRSIRLKQNK